MAPSSLAEAIQNAYRQYAPGLTQRDNAKAWYSSADSPVATELNASSSFSQVDFHAVDWTRELSSQAYCELAATFSDHSTLPSQQRQALLSAIADAIHRNGGVVRLLYTTALFLARRS